MRFGVMIIKRKYAKRNSDRKDINTRNKKYGSG